MANIRPGLMFLVMIFAALIAFELFNYSTTDHALQDLLGNLEFGSLRWSTILAFAFCGIDFAGIARLFTPEQGMDEPKEVWYLFGAWLLAATMNAVLTWWGVSMAIVNHQIQSASIVDPKTISTVVPVFVATMVWVIRILIIGTLSLAMDRALHTGDRRSVRRPAFSSPQPVLTPRASASPQPSLSQRPTLNRAASSTPEPRYARSGNDFNIRNNAQVADNVSRGMPEPTYHSLSMGARPNQSPAAQTGIGDRSQSVVKRT
jgi:hypothetical protein